MPNIEIIQVRFNLSKEDDRRLFDLLQKRAESRKRNEFLKKVLLELLTEEPGSGRVMRRASKKPRGQGSTKINSSRASEVNAEPVQKGEAVSQAPHLSASTLESDPELSELIGSIVQ